MGRKPNASGLSARTLELWADIALYRTRGSSPQETAQKLGKKTATVLQVLSDPNFRKWYEDVYLGEAPQAEEVLRRRAKLEEADRIAHLETLPKFREALLDIAKNGSGRARIEAVKVAYRLAGFWPDEMQQGDTINVGTDQRQQNVHLDWSAVPTEAMEALERIGTLALGPGGQAAGTGKARGEEPIALHPSSVAGDRAVDAVPAQLAHRPDERVSGGGECGGD